MQNIKTRMKKKEDIFKIMFPKGFRDKFQEYFYIGKHLIELASTENYENLFMKSEPAVQIPKIFRLMKTYTEVENNREKGNVHAVYHFDNPFFSGLPARIEIVNNTKSMKNYPRLEQNLESNNLFATKIVDIEFLEKVPMDVESKSGLNDIILEYYNDAGLSRDFVEEFTRDLKTLQDTEKLHLQYAIALTKDKKEVAIPVYIGIGSNQPFKLSEKSRNRGKNRYYRFSLLDGDSFEQTSSLDFRNIPEHEKRYILKNCDLGYSDPHPDGTVIGTILDKHREDYNVFIDDNGREFGIQDEGRYKGVFEWNEKAQTLKRIELRQDTSSKDGKEKIREIVQRKQFGSEMPRQHIETLFPDYDKFSEVFHNPFRMIHSLGMYKTLVHLAKHGLMDSQYLNIENTASDLFMNGFPDYLKMKGISLVAMSYINQGRLDELIMDTYKGKSTEPLGR